MRIKKEVLWHWLCILVFTNQSKLNAMNKLLNYSAIKDYKLPSRKAVFKSVDTIIAFIFLAMLIGQVFS